MLQAYDGYIENGQVIPLEPLPYYQDLRRVIITVLDESVENETLENQTPTWIDYNPNLREFTDETDDPDDVDNIYGI
jgi:hypothetical protein